MGHAIKVNIIVIWVILFLLLSTSTIKATTEKDEYNYYINQNGEACLTKYNGNEKRVRIPETIDGYCVGELYKTFKGNEVIESVFLPYGVYSIGDEVFFGCSNLEEVNCTDSLFLSNLGKKAFMRSGLQRMILSDNITYIPSQCFAQCHRLRYIKATSNKDIYIEVDAFDDTNIHILKVNSNIKYIGEVETVKAVRWTKSPIVFAVFKRSYFEMVIIFTALILFLFGVLYPLFYWTKRKTGKYKEYDLYTLQFENVNNIKELTNDRYFVYEERYTKKDMNRILISIYILGLLLAIIFVSAYFGTTYFALIYFKNSSRLFLLGVSCAFFLVCLAIAVVLFFLGLKCTVKVKNVIELKKEILSKSKMRITKY